MWTCRLLAGCALLALATTIAEAQNVLGTYFVADAQGGKTTLTLQADGPGKIRGSLVGNGVTFSVEGQLDGDDVTGTLRGSSGAAYFEAAREGAQLLVVLIELGADGRPNPATGRELVFTRDDSSSAQADAARQQGGAVAGAPPPVDSRTTPATSAQDQQLSRLFLSSAWCTFSYSGSRTYTGGTAGRSTSKRTVFSADGLMQQSTSSEMTNSGSSGNVWGSNANTETYRWRVQNGALMLAADGAQWQAVRIEVTRNSNGYPIIKADGIEYYQCR